MPPALKVQKFFLRAAKKSGFSKGRILIGVNSRYVEGVDSISLQDLIDFVAKNEINPSDVAIGKFITYAKK